MAHEYDFNEKRALALIKEWGFDFNNVPQDDVRFLIEEEIRYAQMNEEYTGSSEYVRLLCGYLYCIGDKSDIELLKKAKYGISWDVQSMVDWEWIESLENGGVEEEYVRPRDVLIADFIDWYSNY